jgi:hypothetical protein
MSYTAEVSLSSRVAITEWCGVTVVADHDIRQGMESVDTRLRIASDFTREQAIAAAEEILTENGWVVAGQWEDGDDSLYVAVEHQGGGS